MNDPRNHQASPSITEQSPRVHIIGPSASSTGCPDCGAHGCSPADCDCHAAGHPLTAEQYRAELADAFSDCPACDGTGAGSAGRCESCGGVGQSYSVRKLERLAVVPLVDDRAARARAERRGMAELARKVRAVNAALDSIDPAGSKGAA